jgi:hypothetical protein
MFMRPPFLNLRGEEDAALYQAEFDLLYHTEAVYDVLGNKVLFEPNRCEHVCLKSSDEIWNKGPREQWSQERAERIRWILATLCNPYEIRPDVQLKPGDKTKTRIYLLRMEADLELQMPQEYYCVYTTVEAKRLVRFQTAFPITREKWNNLRKQGPCYYPKSEKQTKEKA